MGMELKQIHRVIEFTHSNWLEKYIGNNSQLRKKPPLISKKISISS